MIIPILNGLLRFSLAPVTWILFLVNAGVFLAGVVPTIESQAVMDRYLDDHEFIETQGRLFANFIGENPDSYSDLMKRLAERARAGDEEKIKLLGSLAVRNDKFLREASLLQMKGDQVEIERWRERLGLVRNTQDRHPSYVLGLTADDTGLTKWLSYIFVHSGPYHFIGNMYFLLIFGSMLEPMIGGLALLVVFLASGVVAAGSFLVLSGATAAPLVGASGAVSGIMVLFCLYYWRRPVRFFYMFLPSTQYVGYVFLPAWLVMVMFVLSDIAGYWGSINDFGGVAYSAHLGGESAALLIGVIVYLLRFRKPHRLEPLPDSPAVGQLISFADLVEAMRRQNTVRRHVESGKKSG